MNILIVIFIILIAPAYINEWKKVFNQPWRDIWKGQ